VRLDGDSLVTSLYDMPTIIQNDVAR
jgi:hypothetical protein